MQKLSFIFIFALATAVSAQTPHTLRIFNEGARLAQNARYEKAIEHYRKASLLSENEQTGHGFLARIHFNIGVCHYHLRQPAEAVKEFNEAIYLSRGRYEKAFYALGMAQVELKNWLKAEEAFRQTIRLNRQNGEAWFDLALVLLEKQDYEGAEHSFQKAIEHKSANLADAHNNLGVLFALRGDFGSAEKEFETALIESGGRSSEAQNNLEFCRYYKQNARRDLLAALEFGGIKRNKATD
jgi:Flp pilus assembly protein TadD